MSKPSAEDSLNLSAMSSTRRSSRWRPLARSLLPRTTFSPTSARTRDQQPEHRRGGAARPRSSPARSHTGTLGNQQEAQGPGGPVARSLPTEASVRQRAAALLVVRQSSRGADATASGVKEPCSTVRNRRRRPAFVVVRASRRGLHGPCSARHAGPARAPAPRAPETSSVVKARLRR